MDLAPQFEALAARVSRAQIAVTLILTAIFLFALNNAYAEPEARVAPPTGVVDGVYAMMRDRTDPQLYYRAPAKTESVFRIVWISGSGARINSDSFALNGQSKFMLGDLLADQVHTINGNKVEVLVYYAPGAANIDFLSALKNTLELDQPDRVIVTMNPFWLLNEKKIANANNWWAGFLDRDAYSSSLLFNAWGHSPSNVTSILASSLFKSLNERMESSERLNSSLHQITCAIMPLTKLRNSAFRVPAASWAVWASAYSYSDLPKPNLLSEKMPPGMESLYKMSRFINPDPGSLHLRMLEDYVALAQATRVPVLSYLSAYRPDLHTDTWLAPKLGAVEEVFDRVAVAHSTPNTQFLRLAEAEPEFSKPESAALYRDYYHLRDPRLTMAWLRQWLGAQPGVEVIWNETSRLQAVSAPDKEAAQPSRPNDFYCAR